jgi:Zn-finger protein
VQHFSTAHVDDLEERVNQLMVARHAHTQPLHTHTPHKSCSYCFHPSYWIDDCPFINHYMIDEDDASKSSHEHVQITTTLGSEESVAEIVNETNLEDPLEHLLLNLEMIWT